MELKKALAVMARVPSPGLVKTRLSPLLTPEESAALYTCFIGDIFSWLASLNGVDLFCAYTPAGSPGPLFDPSSGLFSEIGPDGVEMIEQQGEGLGERLSGLFDTLFKRGYGLVAVIGSDSPDMGHERVEKAFTLLSASPGGVVLGPALDGGYYLVAMDVPHDEIFTDISWGEDLVLNETLARIEGRAILLDPFHDIDRPEDLSFLDSSRVAVKSAAYIRDKKVDAKV